MVPEIFMLNWNIFFPRSPKKMKAGSYLWAVSTYATESNEGKKSTRHGPDPSPWVSIWSISLIQGFLYPQ